MERRCTARVNGPAAVKSLAAAARREPIDIVGGWLASRPAHGRAVGRASELNDPKHVEIAEV